MRLSTKGRYSARAMLQLAIHADENPLPLQVIAKREEISRRYLEQLMNMMVSAGLVRSHRGQRGGFSLAKTPKEILLSEVIRAAEGSLAPVYCVDDPGHCHRNALCVTHDIWCEIRAAIQKVLDAYTLADLVEMHYRKTHT